MTSDLEELADPRNPVSKITGRGRLGRILNRLALSSILAGALIAPAHASPTCLIEIDGKRHLDGACQAIKDNDGLLVLGGQGGAAAVIRPRLGDSDRAHGVWQRDPMDRIERLGALERDGMSCWRGTGVRVCAWGAQ